MSSCVSTATGTDEVLVGIYRGDTLRLTTTLTGAADAPVDVTGWGWRCQLRKADDTLAGDLAVNVVDAPGGRLELYMDQLDTAQLDLADYVFDVEATDVGANVRTLLTGKLRIRGDVTR